MKHVFLLVPFLFLLAACNVSVDHTEPGRVTIQQHEGCPLQIITTRVTKSDDATRNFMLILDYAKPDCARPASIPGTTAYTLADAKFDCAGKTAVIHKYRFIGPDDKELGQAEDVREYDQLKRPVISEYVQREHLCPKQ